MDMVISVMGERFKVKKDVVDVYRNVASILGNDSDEYLLVVALALYRTRQRDKYINMITRGLVNEVTRPLLVSFASFYKVYRKVDSKARVKVAKSIRQVLDTLLA